MGMTSVGPSINMEPLLKKKINSFCVVSFEYYCYFFNVCFELFLVFKLFIVQLERNT